MEIVGIVGKRSGEFDTFWHIFKDFKQLELY